MALTRLFAFLLVLHGLIHLLGAAKAFHWAELPQLARSISRPLGVLWLVASGLFIAAGVLLGASQRSWWAIAAAALVVSTVAIASSWADAKAGMLVNGFVLVGIALGFAAAGPYSLRIAFERDVDQRLVNLPPAEIVSDSDIARLPEPVQRYLRNAGVVGQARVANFYVRMHGRIRSGRGARWLPIAAEQYNFIGEPARLFYMTSSMFMIPVLGYHRFAGPTATMKIKAAGVVTVADTSGDEMNRSETVTIFNDMCVMAPATLIDRSITWEPVDSSTARARFAASAGTITAELQFTPTADLNDFVSDDRSALMSDGRTMRRLRWSTPLTSWRSFGAVRLASKGEARWHEPDGEYAYLELTLDEVRYNVSSR
jgi:uncharacterized protein DUF6544